VPVGRRNWTFAGSDAGGHRAAAIYTQCRPPRFRSGTPEVADQIGQPFGPQPDISAVRTDVDALHKQLDNPRLLGGEKFVPERIKAAAIETD